MKTDYHDFSNIYTPQDIRRKLDIGNIWINEATCSKCGDTIKSVNRHDFVECKCGASFIDGGSWYAKYGGEAKSNTIFFNDIYKEENKL